VCPRVRSSPGGDACTLIFGMLYFTVTIAKQAASAWLSSAAELTPAFVSEGSGLSLSDRTYSVKRQHVGLFRKPKYN
jgi:hypothetical protein